MPGTVLTVASGKGGVGKTTTAVNLAVALWRDEHAVALVDADLGMPNLAAVLSLDPGPTLHDVLAGEATAEEAIVEAKNGDLLVLPGTSDLTGFADADPGRLQLVVGDLADRCDYVVVDTGAGLSYEDVLPLGMADAVVLVTTPDPAAVVDTRKTFQLAGLVDAPVLGVVVTRALEGTDAEGIAADLDAPLLGTVPEDPAVTESAIRGDPLESHAPDAPATVAYRELAETVDEAVRDAGFPPSEADRADAGARATSAEPGRRAGGDADREAAVETPAVGGGAAGDGADAGAAPGGQGGRAGDSGEGDGGPGDDRASDEDEEAADETARDGEPKGDEAEAADDSGRRGGVLGWLGRLFS